MNRLPPPSVLAGPMPVKFREVLYNPRLENDNDHDKKSPTMWREGGEAQQKLHTEYIFFKDPLRPPELMTGEENEALTAQFKLGRNMRASHPQQRPQDFHYIMNEKNKLLKQQIKQQVEVQREADSDEKAAVLINDMLQEGFHINPPENTPRAGGDGSTHAEEDNFYGDDEQRVKPEQEERSLLVAMHRELKRLTREA